jgi:hypothetical protein
MKISCDILENPETLLAISWCDVTESIQSFDLYASLVEVALENYVKPGPIRNWPNRTLVPPVYSGTQGFQTSCGWQGSGIHRQSELGQVDRCRCRTMSPNGRTVSDDRAEFDRIRFVSINFFSRGSGTNRHRSRRLYPGYGRQFNYVIINIQCHSVFIFIPKRIVKRNKIIEHEKWKWLWDAFFGKICIFTWSKHADLEIMVYTVLLSTIITIYCAHYITTGRTVSFLSICEYGFKLESWWFLKEDVNELRLVLLMNAPE